MPMNRISKKAASECPESCPSLQRQPLPFLNLSCEEPPEIPWARANYEESKNNAIRSTPARSLANYAPEIK